MRYCDWLVSQRDVEVTHVRGHIPPICDERINTEFLDLEKGQVWDQKLFTIIPARTVHCGC